MIFRRKPTKVVAVQWTGENVDEVSAIVGEKLEADGESLAIETPNGTWTARPSNWVVRDSSDSVYVWTEEAFDASHEAIE